MTAATDISARQIWDVEYFRPGWQTLFDFFNSIPLALLGLGLMIYAQRQGIALLFASIILHALEDLPVHHDDAHRHFLPLSDFRFESPVSYWDPNHYEGIVGALEIGLVLIASIYVLRRARSRWTKGLLVLADVAPWVAYLLFTF